VFGYVGDPVVWPEEFVDLHASFYSVAPYVRRTPGSPAKTAPRRCHGAGFVRCIQLLAGIFNQ
jgi:hypothetical protein